MRRIVISLTQFIMKIASLFQFEVNNFFISIQVNNFFICVVIFFYRACMHLWASEVFFRLKKPFSYKDLKVVIETFIGGERLCLQWTTPLWRPYFTNFRPQNFLRGRTINVSHLHRGGPTKNKRKNEKMGITFGVIWLQQWQSDSVLFF